jgi:hypothetical protein
MNIDSDGSLKLLAICVALSAYIGNVRRDMFKRCTTLKVNNEDIKPKKEHLKLLEEDKKTNEELLQNENDPIRRGKLNAKIKNLNIKIENLKKEVEPYQKKENKVKEIENKIHALMWADIPLVLASIAVLFHWSSIYIFHKFNCMFVYLAMCLFGIAILVLASQHLMEWIATRNIMRNRRKG